MSRGFDRLSRSRTSAWLTIMSLLAGLSACGMWGDDSNSRKTGAQQTSCSLTANERDVLTQLVIQPRPCSATSLCPRGSFCDQEHNYTCNWNCLSDSDCGTGVCTCEGICADAVTSSPDGGTASCGKDQALLTAIKTTPRRCEWDDTCPLGSFCDRGKGTCDWNCFDPSTPCASGQTCDCLGRCITPTTPKDRPMTRLPQLQLSALAIDITGDPAAPPAGWVRTMDVQLTTTDADILAQTSGVRAYAASIHVEAGKNLKVACVDPAVGGVFASSCELTATTGPALPAWTFSLANDHWETRQPIWIKPSSTVDPADKTAWAVRFYSKDVARVPQTIGIVFKPGPTAASAWTDLNESVTKEYFKGTITLVPEETDYLPTGGEESSVPAVIPTSVVGGVVNAMKIPVSGYYEPTCTRPIGAGCLVLIDPTSILSANGAVALVYDGKTDWNALDTKDVSGRTEAAIGSVGLYRHNRTGAVTGKFDVGVKYDVDLPRHRTFYAYLELAKSDPIPGLPECGGGGSCPTGQICSVNAVCVPQRSGFLHYNPASTWASAVHDVAVAAAMEVKAPGEVGLTGWSDIFGGGSFFGDPTNLAPVAILEAAATPGFTSELCTKVLTDAKATGNPSDFVGACTGNTTNCPCAAAQVPAGSIVCLDANHPTSGVVPSSLLLAGSPLPDCQLAQIAPPNSFCSLRSYSFRTTFPGQASPTIIPVYACSGWVDAVQYLQWSRPDSDACFEADPNLPSMSFQGGSRLYQTAPAQGAVTPIRPLLSFSGDPVCEPSRAGVVGPQVPHGVDLISYRDRFPSPTGLTDTGLLAACLSDLTRAVPSLQAVVANPGLSPEAFSNLRAAYTPGACFSPGYFYSILQDLKTYWIPKYDGYVDPPQLPGWYDDVIRSYYVRLLQQWAEMHTFIAQQGLEVHQLSGVDANASIGVSETRTKEPAHIEEVIGQVESGFAFVVQQAMEYQDPLLGLNNLTLGAPGSFRSALNSAPDTNAENHEQTMGLGPVLMEGSVAMLRLAQKYVEETQLKVFSGVAGTDGDARRRAVKLASEAIRLSSTMEDMTRTMVFRVLSPFLVTADLAPSCTVDADCRGFAPAKCTTGHCQMPAWGGRWIKARADYLAVRKTLSESLVALVANSNPLGVASNDLPLFFGDLTGTNSRFFASSDYLLNTWAIGAVTSAQGALQTARQAWLDQRDSRIRDNIQQADQDRKLEQIKLQAGTIVAANCGIDSSVDSATIVDKVVSGAIQLNGCYIQQSAKCAAVPLISSAQGAKDEALKTCISTKMQGSDNLLLAKSGFLDNPCNSWYEAHQSDKTDFDYDNEAVCGCDYAPVKFSFLGGRPSLDCTAGAPIYCQGGTCGTEATKLHSCANSVRPTIWDPCRHQWDACTNDLCFPNSTTCYYRATIPRPAAQVRCVYAKYVQDRNAAMAALDVPIWRDAGVEAECRASQDDPGRKPLTTAARPLECYVGNMGVAALRALGASQDVDLADFQWLDAQQVYEIQGRECVRRTKAAATIVANDAAFLQEMDSLSAARDQMAAFANFGSAIVKAIVNPAWGATDLFGAGISGATQELNSQMQTAALRHQVFLQKVASDNDVATCFVELDKMRAQFGTLQSLVVRRTTDAVAAAQELENLDRTNRHQVEDASTAAQRELSRNAESWSFHYWIDEKVERFNREFAWAKKLVYLSMVAVEYEFQQSLDLRGPILTATHPDQLETAVRALQQEVGSRAINRKRPNEDSLVVSLRDDVLGLQDRRDAASGERALSPSEIIRGRLWDRRYAVYDKDGRWMGQGVPFSLGPQGVLETRCAERLWRVTATVQGDGLSDSQPGTSMLLLKRNTFGSQWCSGLGDGSTYQIGSLQPSNALFRVDDRKLPMQDVSAYSAAQLYPWFNVRRSEFYKTQYQDGASEELAGRGLYGDYVLLFPSQMLLGGRSPTLPPAGGTAPLQSSLEAFPLDHVEDVLLRFDYLSVDNLTPLGN